MTTRYEIPAHRNPDGFICPGSMAVTPSPHGCNRRCHTGPNLPMADAAPSRLEVTYAVLRSLAYDEDMAADLSAEKVNVHPYWDAQGAVALRVDVTRLGITFHYTITVDGDL